MEATESHDPWRTFGLADPRVDDEGGWASPLLHGARTVGEVSVSADHDHTVTFYDPAYARLFDRDAGKVFPQAQPCRECPDCVKGDQTCRAVTDPRAAYLYGLWERWRLNSVDHAYIVSTGPVDDHDWRHTSDRTEATHEWEWQSQTWRPLHAHSH